ncbi:porphobilinogen synthase [Candidatus Binatia bacterium]|jgi:porphobilinogen synthase|nr:porphobilinogen synthase [Candidatus Binatia bacterium]
MAGRFPAVRPRRLRTTQRLRRLVRETRLAPEQLVLPLFVVPGRGQAVDVPSMPGVKQWSVDRVAEEAGRAFDAGVRSVILFGIPEAKDASGSHAWKEDGIVQQALGELRRALPELTLITDVCMCEYTDHGHCGVLDGESVANDPTLELLAREAVSHARAGADVVAPSDMMDGRVGAIRAALDAAGFAGTPILSYAVKYASGLYGPFRDAAQSTPAFGDRRSYQMDPPNAREALRELALDLEEGADMVMVKPALSNLDVLAAVRAACNVPVAAYQVSGEYAMIKAAAANGWIDEARVVDETLIAIRRAGADLILTYFAIDAARRC